MGNLEEKLGVQPKLKVGSAHDVYEREADRVAARVISMPQSSLQTWGEHSYAGAGVQRFPGRGGDGTQAYGDIKLSYGGGIGLSPRTRQFMEPRFGVDFGHVMLHQDRQAQQTAERINARAFTYGNHIWLGRGESEQDQSLMAHELTHVVQQGGGLQLNFHSAQQGEAPPNRTISGRIQRCQDGQICGPCAQGDCSHDDHSSVAVDVVQTDPTSRSQPSIAMVQPINGDSTGKRPVARELTPLLQQQRATTQGEPQGQARASSGGVERSTADDNGGCVNGQWQFIYDGCSMPHKIAVLLGMTNPYFNSKDNPAGGYDTQFSNSNRTGPCDIHDQCYQTCSPGAQAACDREMYDNMKAVCNRSSADLFTKRICNLWAEYYYNALRIGGKSAFDERQAQVCNCAPAETPPRLRYPPCELLQRPDKTYINWTDYLIITATPDSPLGRFRPFRNRDEFQAYISSPKGCSAVQPKLRVGGTHDVYEREADRVAARIVSMPQSSLQYHIQRCQDGQNSGPCAREECPNPGELQPLGQGFQGAHPPHQQATGVSGPISLPEERVRERDWGWGESPPGEGHWPVERAFGDNFSGRRVHADTKLDTLDGPQRVHPLAGEQTTWLMAGDYKSKGSGGKQLVAHEISQTVNRPSLARVQERSYSQDCSRYLTSGTASCEFYKCREANAGNVCGKRGYYLGYGLKYCERFSRTLMPLLSPAGQRWLERTRLCLMEHIDNNIDWNAPCGQVKTSAFDSHPTCYVRSGICFLPTEDWEHIISVIDPEDNDLKQVITTGISCIANWLPLAFPATSLGAGGGYRGLMERDRRRLLNRWPPQNGSGHQQGERIRRHTALKRDEVDHGKLENESKNDGRSIEYTSHAK